MLLFKEFFLSPPPRIMNYITEKFVCNRISLLEIFEFPLKNTNNFSAAVNLSHYSLLIFPPRDNICIIRPNLVVPINCEAKLISSGVNITIIRIENSGIDNNYDRITCEKVITTIMENFNSWVDQ
jgi:hypothetical protein